MQNQRRDTYRPAMGQRCRADRETETDKDTDRQAQKRADIQTGRLADIRRTEEGKGFD